VTIEVVARMRQYLPALVVSYEPGWERRGNGTSANYDFANVHHTATPTSLDRPFPTQALLRDGRVGLSGPLCNDAGPACTVERPRLHVVAAHPANHAGASRASGPVPALSLYNPRTRGLEIDYAGTVPMLAGQLLVAHVWTRANADVLAGGNVEHVRAHAETSVTGKWDPGYAPGRTIDMGAFRRAAAALVAGRSAAASAPQLSGDPVRIVKAVGTAGPFYLLTDLTVDATNDIQLVEAEARANGVSSVDMHLQQIDILIRTRLDRRRALGLPPVIGGADVDEEELAAHLAPLLAATVDQLDDTDLGRIADAAADEVDRRQRSRLTVEA
jgi:hypothetical protein